MSDLDERTARPTATPDPQAAAGPGTATPDVVGALIQNLDGTAQQAAAAAAMAALPDHTTPRVLGRVVGDLDASTAKQAATAAITALPETDRQAVAASVLGSPDPKTQRTLWYLVVATMAGAVFVFGCLAFLLIAWGRPAEAPLALATTALGGVVGLVVTSPVSLRRPHG